jgi:Angiotensin-converting enzyme
MTTDEMLKMLEDWMRTLRPFYLQLHTWAKYELAEKFHEPVPKKIPAHWFCQLTYYCRLSALCFCGCRINIREVAQLIAT